MTLASALALLGWRVERFVPATQRLVSTVVLLGVLTCAEFVHADAPVASYIFPAGGQQGQTVPVHVGGLNLHSNCTFEMSGPGLTASKTLKRVPTFWLEGPRLQLPDSQQAEDYPKDMAGEIKIAADALLGSRTWHVGTSQGVTPGMRFQVGDLPEIVERETAGDPVPVPVPTPITINGRIFPRQDIDIWQCSLAAGQSCSCELFAARLGSPLDAKLEILDPQGRKMAENDDTFASDPFVRFVAPVAGNYLVRVYDTNYRGGQAFVYRLTLSTGPYVERVYPLGGQQEKPVSLELIGQAVSNKPTLFTVPKETPASGMQQLTLSGQKTNAFLFDVDTLPEALEQEPNNEASQAKSVELPCVLNGRIDKPGDVDCWTVSGAKGTQFEIEYRHLRMHSPLETVLIVSSTAGKELLRSEPPAGPSAFEKTVRVTMPVEGQCVITISEQFAKRGGEAFAYRLKMREVKPGFSLQVPSDVLTVNRAAQSTLKITVDRQGTFTDAIDLSVQGLPTGVEIVGKPSVAAKQNQATLTFKAEAEAKVQLARLTITGTAQVAGESVTQPVCYREPTTGAVAQQVMLAVAVPTQFKVVGDFDMRWAARGTVLTRKYRIERGGFTGPLLIMLSDKQGRHLQGVFGPVITVPSEASEFAYELSLPPWMETGRTSRACVMAVGKVRDQDGTEHEVSFTSLNTTEQIIAVVETGRLDVELDRSALTVVPGATLTLGINVLRSKGLHGAAKVEVIVPDHLQGITIEPLTVPADQARGKVVMRFGKDKLGPFNAPLTVRVTVLDGKMPVVGEAQFELHLQE